MPQRESDKQPTRRNPRHVRSCGFTLIELMITVIVIGVVMVIGVPSFARLLQDNRLVGSSNELVVALQVARTEAVKRGESTVLCARAAAGGCSGNDTWGNGWMLFVDANGDGSWAGSGSTAEPRVRTWGGPEGDINITMGGNQIGYDALGLASNTQSFTVQPSGCSGGEPNITVNVSISGTAETTRGTC